MNVWPLVAMLAPPLTADASPSWLVRAINAILLGLGDAAQWIWHTGFGAIGDAFARLSDTANPVLAPTVRGLNIGANAIGGIVFAPIGMMPGWLSNTLISAVTGVLLLLIFKYTSNQKAIGRVKDDIKANMLALKLFKDNLGVTFRSQGRVFLGSLRLLRYALFPLLVMMIPVSLLLGQLGVWYQYRPLAVGETALVTMQFDETDERPGRPVLAELPGAEVAIGPVRIHAERQAVWEIRAVEPGRHTMVFEVDGKTYSKSLVVGEGLARVSAARPSRAWTTLVLHPLEAPFGPDDVVQSIAVEYPEREGLASGADAWLVWFFVASMVFALLFKPLIGVRI